MITLKADTQQRGERIQTEAHRLYLQVCLGSSDRKQLYRCALVLKPIVLHPLPSQKKEAFRLK